MAMQFVKATKSQSRLRLGLIGASNSGKTWTALAVACAMGEHVAVIDTERGSAAKYSDLFSFDVLALQSFSPQNYIDAIHTAEEAGYDVIVIDSLTHEWDGKDGCLEMVDKVQATGASNNKFTAWSKVTPLHNQFIGAILNCKCHLIATMRTKTEYVLEQDIRGKMVPRKVGMAPVQREGFEYELDIIGTLNDQHDLTITKTRYSALDGKTIEKPNKGFAEELKKWLSDGNPVPPPIVAVSATAKPATSPVGEKAQPASGVVIPPDTAPAASKSEPVAKQTKTPETQRQSSPPAISEKPANMWPTTMDGWRDLASEAAKKHGAEAVRTAIFKVTGGRLSDAKAEHYKALAKVLKELSA